MNENEIIINEEVMDEVMEVIPEKAGANFGKIGFVVLAAGAVAALGYKVYKIVKEKKAQKAQTSEPAAQVIDFEPEESDE